jgi:hypothetical protein
LGEVVVLRGRIAKRLREEAKRLGVSVDEYIVELLSQNLDPESRAVEYAEAAGDLLEEAREELGKGNVRQAAEKVWGAAALAVKAYAYWREGMRLSSRGELWEYKRKLAREVGGWVHNSWASAVEMHVCFYEGWCAPEDVESALEPVGRLVDEIALRVRGRRG